MYSQKKRGQRLSWITLFFLLVTLSYSQNQPFLKLSVKDYSDFSRLIIESSFLLNASFEKSSSYLMAKLGTKVRFRLQREAYKSRVIKSIGWTKTEDYYILNIKIIHSNFTYDYFTLSNPPQLVIDISLLDVKSDKKKSPLKTSEILEKAGQKEKIPSPSPRGIKSVVIDPGHGGLEKGAKGKFGALEKDITLQISLKLKAIIERNLAFRVILTRDKDVDVSLENRASIANNNRASLFISIHTNSSYRKEASGSETFFLSLNASDEEARRLAYLENNSVEFERRIGGGNEDEIKMILWDMAQAAYLKQSSRLAESIQKELNLLLGTMNRGIKQAPFKVLTGVASPAVLVEVAFISNPQEERKLLNKRFQNNVAQAIYRGMANYIKLYSQE